MPCGSPQHPGDHAAGGGRKIDLAADGGQLQTMPVGKIDHIFKLSRGAGEAVHMPADDGVDHAFVDVLQEFLPLRPGRSGVRADVVVRVNVYDIPPLALA